MTRTAFTARGFALLALAFLGCNEAGGEAPPQVSTQRKELADKTLSSMGSMCESAQQPRLVVAPSEDASESTVRFEGKELNCGETYELVVSEPDGTSSSESLVADTQGKVRSTYVIEGPPGDHQATLYDSSGEEVAQLLSHNSTIFRYGHLTWRTVAPRTAEFSLVNVFRRTYPGSGPDGLAVTGDIFQEVSGNTSLCFGDGTCTGALTYQVTRYDAQQGWLMAQAITSTQPQPQPGTGVTVTEREPNDSLAAANSMQLGDDYLSTISAAYERDYVSFTLTQQTQVELRTVLQTMRDSYLYLYDSNGGLLATDDDSGGALSSRISIRLNAGTYYVAAAGFSSHTGSQLVQLRRLAAPPPGPITRTYSTNGPFTATVTGCCRISNLSNSGGGNYRLQTRVDFTVANSAPVSTLPPIIEAPTRTPGFSFQIPATDAEGDALTFRLATSSESSIWTPASGLTVSSTGLVSWNTTGTVSGQLWTAQVIIEERRNGVLIGSSAVDFLLQITGDSGTPPTCVPPPQAHYTVTVGQTLRFTVGAQDPDVWDTVTLSASSVPSGATMQPALPLRGPSGLSSTFSYTPTRWDAGYVVSPRFTVTDTTGQTGQCTVTIAVQAPSNWPPVANAGPDQTVSEGATVTLNGTGSSDQEGHPLTYSWSVVSGTGPAVTLSSVTSATPSVTPSDDGVYTFLLTVTDSLGATGSDTVVVRVNNVAPRVSATGGQVDEGQEFTSSGSFMDPGADTWTATVDYGDGTGVQPLALDNGTFTLSHRYLDNRRYNSDYSVRIAVTDDNGGQGSIYVSVAVRNVAPVMTHPSSLTVHQGQTLVLPITFTDPGQDSWSASVDYGDGHSDSVWSSGHELTFEHTYYAPGTSSLTVTLWDDDGGAQTVTIPLVVHNVAPTVSFAGGDVDEGSDFYGYGSFEDPGSWRESYTLTVNYGDGTGEHPLGHDPYYPNSLWFWHAYADSGTYLVTVTVTDSHGGVGRATATVVVNNVAPWVYLENSWRGFSEGSPMELWASFHDPGTQDTWTATADYGDGTGEHPVELTGGNFTLSHVYANNGVYTVTLTVRDDDGGVGSATSRVHVYNVAPTVSATGGALDEGSTFSSSGSFTDPGADTWTARVHYGDGGGWQPLSLQGKSFNLEHSYANSGTYWVTILVRDSDGAEGSVTTYAIVRNVAPVVTATGGSANEGSAFVSSGSFIDPGTESGWYASIDYGDGSYEAGVYLYNRSFTLNHVYADNGTYTVTIRIWDDAGVGTTTVRVVVHNVAPTVRATGGSGNEGASIELRGSYTDPSSRDTAVARIDYGDGSPVETIHFWDWYWNRTFRSYHRYADNGTYRVTISVIDDDGGIGTATVLMEIRNVPPSLRFTKCGSASEGSPCESSGQISDPGADTWTITLRHGDGSPPEQVFPSPASPTTFTASHVYDDNGVYDVTVTVTDDDGGSTTFSTSLYVSNVAPTVTASNDSPRYWGVPVTLVGTATDPSLADTQAGFTSFWSLGDDTRALGLTTTHAYSVPGTYSARLGVMDKDGGNAAPVLTTVTIQKRPGAVTCQDTTAVFGFPAALSARFRDELAGGLPGGNSLSFRLGDSTHLGSATTDASGQAREQSPGLLMPGTYPLTVSFTGNAYYTEAQATCTLTIARSQGQLTGGVLRFSNGSSGGFNVMRQEGGPLQGELQFQNQGTSFHAHELTALGLSEDKRQGWFAGVGRDGRAFTAYVEDNGEPGTADVFKLWLDGVLLTDDGAISGGNIQIH